MPSELVTQKLGRLFAIYDARGEGRLERGDYELLAHRIAEARGHELGSEPHELITREVVTQFERIKAVADSSPRDGSIGLDEWMSFFSIVLSDDTAFEAVVGSFVTSIFSMFDLDENRLIDAAELARLREAFGIPDDSGELLAALDQDSDGRLSTAEVRRAIEAFFRSDDPDEPANRFFGPL